MNDSKKSKYQISNRRDILKFSGLALSGLAIGGVQTGPRSSEYSSRGATPTSLNTEKYSYLDNLTVLDPLTPLEPNEMRISFMGSMIPPTRRAQAEMSVLRRSGVEPRSG